jgi:hypothetical protein
VPLVDVEPWENAIANSEILGFFFIQSVSFVSKESIKPVSRSSASDVVITD